MRRRPRALRKVMQPHPRAAICINRQAFRGHFLPFRLSLLNGFLIRREMQSHTSCTSILWENLLNNNGKLIYIISSHSYINAIIILQDDNQHSPTIIPRVVTSTRYMRIPQCSPDALRGARRIHGSDGSDAQWARFSEDVALANPGHFAHLEKVHRQCPFPVPQFHLVIN